MTRVRQYEIKKLAEVEVFGLGVPLPLASGGWVSTCDSRNEVIQFGRGLEELHRWELGKSWARKNFGQRMVSLNSDCSRLAVSERDGLRVYDRSGKIDYELKYDHPWPSYANSGTFFDCDDRLWFIMPGNMPGENDQLVVISLDSGRTLTSAFLENEVGVFEFYSGPDSSSTLISLACGQDGCFVFFAQLKDAQVVISRFQSRELVYTGGISPNSQEIVASSLDGRGLTVHSVPTGKTIANFERSQLRNTPGLTIEESDLLGYHSFYVNSNTILANSEMGRLLLIDREQMELVGTLLVEGEGEKPLLFIGQAERGKVLLMHNNSALLLCDLSSV